MPKPALTLVEGRAVNAADRPLAGLVEEALSQAETVSTAALNRQDYWTRQREGAARGNALARHLADREMVFLAGQNAAVAVLHEKVSHLALYLKAEGYLA